MNHAPSDTLASRRKREMLYALWWVDDCGAEKLRHVLNFHIKQVADSFGEG